jgi:hypothetical protein
MISKIFIQSCLILACFIALNTCNSEPNKDEKTNDQELTDSAANSSKQLKTGYQCPMKCEGEKTYAEAGKCPECDMDLAKLE